MTKNELPTLSEKHSFSLSGFDFPDILAPAVRKGGIEQAHNSISVSGRSVISLKLDLADAAEKSCTRFKECCAEKGVTSGLFPYGMAEMQWQQYSAAPHSYIALGGGEFQSGLNYFDRFLHIDIEQGAAWLVDPGIGDEMLSSTNFCDRANGVLWFASWPVEDAVRRMTSPRENVSVSIWKSGISAGDPEKIWQGDFGDSLHQVSINPSGRYLVLTELGLCPDGPVPQEMHQRAPLEWQRVLQRGIVPSRILFLDLKTGRQWQCPALTAGHIEFDPLDENICYLSGHNIGLFGPKVGIFGPGKILKYRLRDAGPELIGTFTHEDFHRITTHTVFRYSDRTLIGVSGYPGSLFLIDAATMKLYRTIKFGVGEKVRTLCSPHICGQDSYGIQPSRDGDHILIAGTGFVRVADVGSGALVCDAILDNPEAGWCFTGHLGMAFSGGVQ